MRLLAHIRHAFYNIGKCHCVQQQKFPFTSIAILSTLFILASLQIANLIESKAQLFKTATIRSVKDISLDTSNLRYKPSRSRLKHLDNLTDSRTKLFKTATILNANDMSLDTNDLRLKPSRSNLKHLDKSCERYPPKAIVFGVTKCGTGPLSMFLTAHPDIDNAPVQNAGKAVNYFHEHYQAGVKWYISQMPCSEPNRMIVDHDSQYFRREKVPKRVYKFNNTIKLILLVREPISRTISQFLQSNGSHRITASDLESFVLDKSGTKVDTDNFAVSASSYQIHMQRWLHLFPINQFHIIDAFDFANDPVKQLKELEEFLGVRSYFNSENVYFNETRGFHCVKLYYKEGGYKCSGSNKGRVHPQLTDTTYNLLKEHFDPLNELFFKAIGKVFNWTTIKRGPLLLN